MMNDETKSVQKQEYEMLIGSLEFILYILMYKSKYLMSLKEKLLYIQIS